MTVDTEKVVSKYLRETATKDWPRIDCCNSSRSLYCPECHKILIPGEDWPADIRDGTLRLPFKIDIYLDTKERKTSATGIQVAAIASAVSGRKKDDNVGSVQIYHFEHDSVPSYNISDSENVYVLFPEEGSVPITSVGDIDRLIVLDIKWSRQSGKRDTRFGSIKRVHLESPPAHSHYWRWHNSGTGMLCTVEAIYWATMEVTQNKWSAVERSRLIHIMWLFAIQHNKIRQKSKLEQRAAPFSETGKSQRRLLRQLHPGRVIQKEVIGKSI